MSFTVAVLCCSVFLYYEFAVQNWANQTYQIHGLWPADSAKSYPSWCGGTTFQQVTGAQYDDMLRYWNTDYAEGNQAFWKHEWDKHGTCVQEQTGMSQDQYFDTALAIFKRMLPQNTTWTCGATTDCIVACLTLEMDTQPCPTVLSAGRSIRDLSGSSCMLC